VLSGTGEKCAESEFFAHDDCLSVGGAVSEV
jgi:hypothetical protein